MLPHDLACVAQAQQAADRAEKLFTASLGCWQKVGSSRGTTCCQAGLVRVAVVKDDADGGARLFGAAGAARDVGGVFESTDVAVNQRSASTAHQPPGGAALAAAWAGAEQLLS